MISQARVVVVGGGMMGVGVTTSSGFGQRIQKSLAFACVEPEFAEADTQFEVEGLEDRRKATLIEAEPACDPNNERLRA